MKLLFVVGHPAHVHLFRHVIGTLRSRGHEILVGAISREVTTRLLDAFGIPHFVFGASRPELISKALDILPKDLALLCRASDFDPDVLVSTGSPYAAHTSAIIDRPHLAFGDTEGASLVARLMLPFTDAVCTPNSFAADYGPKHVRYNGSKELAYLHPRYFTPDPGILGDLGFSEGEAYIVVRLASWDSSHDLGVHGFAFRDVTDCVSFLRGLENRGRVVLTADRPLPAPLQAFGVAIAPERMHDLLAFSSLYIGEGATMAAEAGVLGVPWIFVSTTGRGFLEEQERRYGLGHWVSSTADALQLADMLLSQPDLHRRWKAKRDVMLADKVDVTRFMLEFIEGWPRSFEAARQQRNARAAQALAVHPG